MTITRELVFFLWFILDGVAGGLFFDLLRAMRHNRKIGDLAVYLEDIIFWILLGGSAIWLTYFLDAGPIRMYMIVGIFLGMILYLLTLNKIAYKLLDILCRYIVWIFRLIIKMFRRMRHEKESESA